MLIAANWAGVDDAFIITNALDALPASDHVALRVQQAYERSAMSITLTSLTDIFAFLLGATGKLPAVRFFCIYASLSIFFIWLFHLTLYPALLALDEERKRASRADLLCCITVSSPDTSEHHDRESRIRQNGM
jgi:predicted RND superfamily exporter protein